MEEENYNFNVKEKPKEDTTTGALTLVSLSQEKLDCETAVEIQALHQKVCSIVLAKSELIHQKPKTRIEKRLPQFDQRDLPPIKRLAGVIGPCSKPFVKQLTESDVLVSQNRLLFNRDFAKEELLPLLNPNENLNNGIEVKTYDLEGKEYDMVFKNWDLPRSRSQMFHLQKEWRKFVTDHDLKHIEDWVCVWMFRHNQTNKLCFAIISKRRPVTSSSLTRNVRRK